MTDIAENFDASVRAEEDDADMAVAESRFVTAQREYEDAYAALDALRIERGQESLTDQLRRLEDEEAGPPDNVESLREDLAVEPGDDAHMVTEVTAVLQVKTINSAALAKCPTHVLLPSHYRPDGTCLHDLREREAVIFHAGFLDDDVREAYNGQKAVILSRIESERPDGPDFLIEFASGNRLTVFANEVTPDA